MEELEKRIANLEIAILAFVGIIIDTLPAAYAEEVEKLSEKLFNSSESLGGFKSVVFNENPGEPNQTISEQNDK